jgi:hypothetical protein
MVHAEQRNPRESIGSFASAFAAAPQNSPGARTFCAWRGSLPWHALPTSTLQQLLERSGTDASQSLALAQRFSPQVFLGSHPHRDLVECSTLHELVHGFIAHTDHWFVRMTQNEARGALMALIERVRSDEHYEFAITCCELPWSVVLHESRSAEMWGAQEMPQENEGRVVSRSAPLVETLATYFDGLWNDRETLQQRREVLDALAGKLQSLEHRRIF